MPYQPLTLCLLCILLLGTPATGRSAVTVETVAELQEAVNQANSGGDPTILVADGTYNLHGVYLRITRDGITVRSQSGIRADVIIDGNYQTTEIFQIVASKVTIADMTLKRAQDHPIHVMATTSYDVTGTMISNIHIIDPGEQAIKINQDGGKSHSVNFGTVSESLIELTTEGRLFVENDTSNSHPCYTGGIDAHGATGWQVKDNRIKGFWCSTGLSEHGVHFWSDSADTLVERNLIIDCDRGIGFGLGSSGHQGGIIRNNMIYHPEDHGHSDVGIGLESAADVQVYNNTIFHDHSYPNAIEYRFTKSTGLTIVNNLTNRAITSRNGGSATRNANNVTSASSDWFVNPNGADLHLAAKRSGVVDAGAAMNGLRDDFDRALRPQGSGIDIGADEYGASSTSSPITGGKAFSWMSLLLLDKSAVSN